MTEYLTDSLVPMLAGHWNGLRHEEHTAGNGSIPKKSRPKTSRVDSVAPSR
jgi:hypothetical protein